MKKADAKRIAAGLCAAMMMISTACGSADDTSKASRTVKKDTNSQAAGAAVTQDKNDNNDVLLQTQPETAMDGAEYERGEKGLAFEGLSTEAVCADDGFYMPGDDGSSEEYKHYDENGWINTADQPISTFSTDIDTASFTNARRMINQGWEVYSDAVRTEEFINYFKYDYQMPEGEAVSINTELSDCPWNPEVKLMLVGIQAMEAPVQDIDSNIVFLIDVSGSMEEENKLPLVRQAFALLADQLGPNDRVSIVTYAGEDSVVLEGTAGDDTNTIKNALDSLTAGGSTAGAAGINTAYSIAEKYFIKGGNNRVILATDGDLNVGVSSAEELTALIEGKRDSGIALSVLGFGTGNFKDSRLEALADNGNGNYAYIDTLDEAKRVLVTEMNGSMFTVAKDTKVQVGFDESKIRSYRLVGYENRQLNTEDFEDDTKDAGDIGSGQQSTALYEIIPAGGIEGDLLDVSVRYKYPEESESRLVKTTVNASLYSAEKPANLEFAALVAEFAMYLKGSEYLNDLTLSEIIGQLKGAQKQEPELIEMAENYARML
ncbi:MAG: von Willebrand factor type A domain-containing protein [Ruminococcus sp.]|nr:von Willebrand factor type A domain-containing protein [Ruminococcus sp.]